MRIISGHTPITTKYEHNIEAIEVILLYLLKRRYSLQLDTFYSNISRRVYHCRLRSIVPLVCYQFHWVGRSFRRRRSCVLMNVACESGASYGLITMPVAVIKFQLANLITAIVKCMVGLAFHVAMRKVFVIYFDC